MEKRLIFAAVVLCFSLMVGTVSHAALTFGIDCDRDGIIDDECSVPVGVTVIADVYVSNVPEPGLINAACTITYDASLLEVNATLVSVDASNWWLGRDVNLSVPGEITLGGSRLKPGLPGDMVFLSTISFTRKEAGDVPLTIYTRDDPDRSVDDFVLADYTVLDSEVEGGLPVGIITAEQDCGPDLDCDGDVDGRDLYLLTVCTENCPLYEDFAEQFGY